jgi:hypothetical protein
MELFISDTLWVITHSATAVQRVPYRVRRRRHWHGLWLSAWCPQRSAPVARLRLAAATAGARETLARAAGTQTGCWPTASRASQMFPPRYSWLHVHAQRVNENPSWFDLVSWENSRSKEVRQLRTCILQCQHSICMQCHVMYRAVHSPSLRTNFSLPRYSSTCTTIKYVL